MKNYKQTVRTKKFGIKYSTYSNLKKNLYIGIARGIGSAFGFTILGAIVLFIIQYIPYEKIPFIGGLIKEFTNIVQK